MTIFVDTAAVLTVSVVLEVVVLVSTTEAPEATTLPSSSFFCFTYFLNAKLITFRLIQGLSFFKLFATFATSPYGIFPLGDVETVYNSSLQTSLRSFDLLSRLVLAHDLLLSVSIVKSKSFSFSKHNFNKIKEYYQINMY